MKKRLPLLFLVVLCGCAVNKIKPQVQISKIFVDTVNTNHISHSMFEDKIMEMQRNIEANIKNQNQSDLLYKAIDSVHYSHIRRYKSKRVSQKVAFWSVPIVGSALWLMSAPSAKGNDGMATGMWYIYTPFVTFTCMALGDLIGEKATGPQVSLSEAETLNIIINKYNLLSSKLTDEDE